MTQVKLECHHFGEVTRCFQEISLEGQLNNERSGQPVSASDPRLSVLCALCKPLPLAIFWTAVRCKLDSLGKLPVYQFFELNQRECGLRIRGDKARQFVASRETESGLAEKKTGNGTGSSSAHTDDSCHNSGLTPLTGLVKPAWPLQ